MGIGVMLLHAFRHRRLLAGRVCNQMWAWGDRLHVGVNAPPPPPPPPPPPSDLVTIARHSISPAVWQCCSFVPCRLTRLVQGTCGAIGVNTVSRCIRACDECAYRLDMYAGVLGCCTLSVGAPYNGLIAKQAIETGCSFGADDTSMLLQSALDLIPILRIIWDEPEPSQAALLSHSFLTASPTKVRARVCTALHDNCCEEDRAQLELQQSERAIQHVVLRAQSAND